MTIRTNNHCTLNTGWTRLNKCQKIVGNCVIKFGYLPASARANFNRTPSSLRCKDAFGHNTGEDFSRTSITGTCRKSTSKARDEGKSLQQSSYCLHTAQRCRSQEAKSSHISSLPLECARKAPNLPPSLSCSPTSRSRRTSRRL